jgi:hypothetical protein
MIKNYPYPKNTRQDTKVLGIVKKMYLKYSDKFETLDPSKVLPL